MLARRLIACLDVRDSRVVKGVRFEGLRDAGDPAELAGRYSTEGIDEIVLLDIVATLRDQATRLDYVRATARRVCVPLMVGGGIRSLADAADVFEAGADKVGVNSAALTDPSIIGAIADRYGSQAIVVAIDAKRDVHGHCRVFARSGTTADSREAVAWAREAESRGAGEILLTSIDRDGTRAGFDDELTAEVSQAVRIPVIASGGAGAAEHFVSAFTRGRADAALAASVFHEGRQDIRGLKTYLADAGIPMRLEW